MQGAATLDRRTPSLATAVSELRERAQSHCESSAAVNPVLANAYRRRAAELALAAWVGELRRGSCDEPQRLGCVA